MFKGLSKVFKGLSRKDSILPYTTIRPIEGITTSATILRKRWPKTSPPLRETGQGWTNLPTGAGIWREQVANMGPQGRGQSRRHRGHPHWCRHTERTGVQYGAPRAGGTAGGTRDTHIVAGIWSEQGANMWPQGRGHCSRHRGHPHWSRHMERTGGQYGRPRAGAPQAAQGTPLLVQAYGANRWPSWGPRGAGIAGGTKDTPTGAGIWSEQKANMGPRGRGHRRRHRGHPHWCKHMEGTGGQYGASRARAPQAAQGTPPLVQAYGANKCPIWGPKGGGTAGGTGDTPAGAGIWSEQGANMESPGRGHSRRQRGHPRWCRHMERTEGQYGAPRAGAPQAAQGTPPLVQAYGDTPTGAGI